MSSRFSAVLGSTSQLEQPGTMKMMPVEGADTQVLVVRSFDNKFYALGGKCSHYKGLLASGVLSHRRVRCPLHGACFRLTSGEIEDYPGVDCIRSFHIEDRNGELLLKADSAEEVAAQIVQRPTVKRNAADKRRAVIIGGGPAGFTTAETLRQNGWAGSVTIVTAELDAPYDRPKLSKKLDAPMSEVQFRPDEHYHAHSIHLKRNCRATKLDAAKKTVVLSDQTSVPYDKLFLAFGAQPRTFHLAKQPSNLYYLRDRADAAKILKVATDRNVVVIGSSFIGMELASSLVKGAKSVTVIGSGVPFQNVFGNEVGKAIRDWYETKGVKFLSASVTDWKIEGDRAISCSIGDKACGGDIFLAGIGVQVHSKWLQGSGVKLNEKTGAIVVNQHMETGVDGVYAAGDCSAFPLESFGRDSASVHHVQMAHHLGHVAALNAVGGRIPVGPVVPFFWTMNFMKSLRYAGYCAPGFTYDKIRTHGDVQALKFVAYYLREQRVIAVASIGFDPVVSRYAELMHTQAVVINEHHVKSDPLFEKLARETFSKLAKG